MRMPEPADIQNQEDDMVADNSIEQYLKEIQIPLRLSCVSNAGWPVVLSLWYLFEDVAYLEQDSRCAFEIASDQPPYCGVRGRALATIDHDRGLEILERLLERYLGDTDNALARQLLNRSVAEVAIRLAPQRFHTWDFTDRMANSVPGVPQKLCPE
jgi:hypothetical protein